jgi:hypothetical protein
MPVPATLSYTVYTASGTTATFGVGFPYLERADITVTDNGTPVTFTWLNDQTVQLNSTPAAGHTIRIQRKTPIDHQMVVEADGSTLSAADLNEQDQQNLYLIQELYEQIAALQAQITSLVTVAGNLPAVTVANNGQVLQVVSGVWTLVPTSQVTVVYDEQVDGVNLKLQKRTVTLTVIGSAPTPSGWTDIHTGQSC